jgi:hypothetical protein
MRKGAQEHSWQVGRVFLSALTVTTSTYAHARPAGPVHGSHSFDCARVQAHVGSTYLLIESFSTRRRHLDTIASCFASFYARRGDETGLLGHACLLAHVLMWR